MSSNTLWSTVRGTHDILGDALWRQRMCITQFTQLATLWGFAGIDTPLIEQAALFERTTPDADITRKELFRLVPRNDRDAFVLRPEGTASVLRALLNAGLTQSLPLKLFYHGPMFRYDRPQKGRMRQFSQIGIESLSAPVVDTAPSANMAVDLEAIALAHTLLTQLPLTEKPRLHINTLGDEETQKRYGTCLQDYLTPYRDTLSDDSQHRLDHNPLRILDSKSPQDQALVANAPKLVDMHTPTTQKAFEGLCAQLDALGIPWVHEPTLVRGLDYYCHTVFEFKSPHLGSQDTVLAGGRYDRLSTALGGPPMGGVGWAAGVERLMLLVDPDKAPSALTPVAFLPQGEADLSEAMNVATTLRQEGLPVLMMCEPCTLKKRLKKASQKQCRYVVIMGEEERKAQQVQVKNMDTGAQETVALDHLVSFMKGPA
ncbi:histidine--tRNA ligase [Candidatus Hepatobacter penaei]|uniref:histidine--tRNA ligase n=1 Tax=Candidatus Hepatobacter penaei TaxID=1274402 RepID=UPI0004F318F6|nr:histidine--tRNA ligase [Candidatus Hepatobacter penaei]